MLAEGSRQHQQGQKKYLRRMLLDVATKEMETIEMMRGKSIEFKIVMQMADPIVVVAAKAEAESIIVNVRPYEEKNGRSVEEENVHRAVADI